MAVWSIVLAAGRGRRLHALTGGVPKQFWSLDGGPSLLEETVARIAPLTPVDRIVTVVDRSQRPYVATIERRGSVGILAYQPQDAGTAAGVLLGLGEVVEHDPLATVLLTPSDHGVRNARAFVSGLAHGLEAIRNGRAGVVLFGVQPSSPAGDYGWITPSPSRPDGHLAQVSAFVEKPYRLEAERLFRRGALWNTMVMGARAADLLDLYETHLPELARRFGEARAMPPADRTAFLDACYRTLPPADFSRDLVSPARGLWTYSLPLDTGWSDLGTPDRVAAWLGRDRAPSRLLPAKMSAA